MVLATGAGPAVPPIDGIGDVNALTNETVWDLDTRPEPLAVLGGGTIGCELAQAFARLGSTVTVIEGLDRVLPHEDPEVSAVIAEALRADGVTIHTGKAVERITPLDPKGSAQLHLAGGSVVEAERLLVAVAGPGPSMGSAWNSPASQPPGATPPPTTPWPRRHRCVGGG